MYKYEKPTVELIDFSVECILDGPEIKPNPGSITEGEQSGDDF